MRRRSDVDDCNKEGRGGAGRRGGKI